MVLIDLEDCYRDSPQLRSDINAAENNIQKLSDSLRAIENLGKVLIEQDRGNQIQKQ